MQGKKFALFKDCLKYFNFFIHVTRHNIQLEFIVSTPVYILVLSYFLLTQTTTLKNQIVFMLLQ